jgi:hypothetical protein
MSLEEELRAIWNRYGPQRMFERDAGRLRQEAERDLVELNAKRGRLGLPHVSEQRGDPQLCVSQAVSWQAPPRMWRDELDSELLTAVKHFFENY